MWNEEPTYAKSEIDKNLGRWCRKQHFILKAYHLRCWFSYTQ
jgi:hypothetical protein